MKILFISDEDQYYGAAKAMVELIIELKKSYNINPIVLTCNYGPVNKRLEREGIETIVTGHRPFFVGESKSYLKRFLKNTLKLTKIFYSIKNKLAIKMIKKSVLMRDIDLIYTNVNRIDLGAVLSKQNNIPHIWHIREFGDVDYPLESYKKDYIQFMNSHANRFIAISSAVKKAWIDKGINESKIKLIYDGVDLENISPELKTYSRHEKVKIVFIGSISDTKQQVQLIEAMNVLPKNIKSQITVDFYGTGSEEYIKMLTAKINKYQIQDQINFKGYVPNVSDAITDYDIGVIASRSEGFGRVTIEYMANGLCVLATNTGANPELIMHQKTGLIYEYGNINDLAKNLESVILNESVRRELGYYAKKDAFSKFTKEINAKNIMAEIKTVLCEIQNR